MRNAIETEREVLPRQARDRRLDILRVLPRRRRVARSRRGELVTQCRIDLE